MSQQLKLDIDRPAWHETNYKSVLSDSRASNGNPRDKEHASERNSERLNRNKIDASGEHSPSRF